MATIKRFQQQMERRVLQQRKEQARLRQMQQTRRWLREEFALWATMDTTPALPEEWFPTLPNDPSCSQPEPDESAPPQPGMPGDEGKPQAGGDEPGDEEGKGGGSEEQDTDAEGGDEDDGEAGGGEDDGDKGASKHPDAPQPTTLTPRKSPADDPATQDTGLLFSHRARRDGDGNLVWRREFSSVQDFIRQPFVLEANRQLFMKEQLDLSGNWRSWKDSQLRGFLRSQTDDTWYGAPSGEEAADRAVRGWAEGAERVRQMLADVEAPTPVSVKRKLRRGDQGDELDIHAVYRGALDRAWSRRQRTHHRSRMTVRLALQVGGSKTMVADEMFWRGAAIAKLTEVLEDAGYGVEVVCAESTLQRSNVIHQLFVLKDAGSPLNLDQLAGVVCNAGFFRTWCFRGMYAIAEVPLQGHSSDTVVGCSYVNHVDLLTDEDYLLGDDGTPTFVVPFRVSERESALEFIHETLAAVEAGVQEAA